MNSSSLSRPGLLRPARLALAISSALVMAGCAFAPGPYLGVKATGPDNADWGRFNPNQSLQTAEPPYSDDVNVRADIHAITPASITQMKNEKVFAEAAAAPSTPVKAAKANAPYEYRVGAQDVLRVTVWNHPELNNPSGTANELAGRVVNQDGNFFYPFVGQIKAAGRTVTEIRNDLAKRLTTYLVEPQVDVSVLQYRSQRVFAVGELQTPGTVQVTDVPLTITDLVTQAGGLTPEADLRAATITQNGQTRQLDLYALYYEGDVSQNVRLSNGDIVTIPENRFNKIFVLGEVGEPQSVVMPRGRMTLAEAISDTGGFNPLSANAGQVYVIRGGDNNRPQIWHLNASSPDALILADRFDLQARDVVYVDPAAVARWSRVINNILPSANLVRSAVQ